MAIGVARPRAHGHAITRMDIAMVRLNWMSRPASIQPMNTATAMTMTVGTNTAATLSAMFATGALVPWAISIMRAIWNRTVSSPVFSILALRLPAPLTVAPYSVSPGLLSTGMLSPVSMDSLTEDSPETTVASAGTFSPGLISTMSPTASSDAGTTVSTPSMITVASSGAIEMSFRRESLVRILDLASMYLPMLTRAMIMPTES